MAIQPKVKVHTDVFFSFVHDIRPKIMDLINLTFLFVYDHSTKNEAPH